MSKAVRFLSNRPWLNKESLSVPRPMIKSIPEWYRKADRFYKYPTNNEYAIGPDGGKVPTWKACPAIFDIMGTGYSFNTPCDLEFFINDKGLIDCNVMDKQFVDFIQKRDPMPQFVHPHGYHEKHFAFWIDWNIELPKGYSALYLNPANRYDLPFLVTQGIVDNDNVKINGTVPFFVKNNFVGVIPAGTAYVQVIPFKREDWLSEIIIEDSQILYSKNTENSKKYRVPNGGVYKNEVHQPRRYE